MNFRELFRPSGGIYYHLRAWRYRSLWRHFTEQVREWLEEWRPAKVRRGDLLLLGPSAGYTLPREWLKQYARIIAVDVDPVAPYLFQKLHPECTVEFVAENIFWRNGRLTLEPLKNIFMENPTADILFSNVLGQVLLEGRVSENEWLNFLKDLRGLLEGRTWASYHDLRSRQGREVIDHLMDSSWSTDLARRGTAWQVTPSKTHEIEFVFTD